MGTSRDLEILCLRHGKTDYTEKPRDLTPEGEAHVRQVAKDMVLPWMDEHRVLARDLEIYSSSAPRAHCTAWSIADVIAYDRFQVPTLSPLRELGPMRQYDEVRAKEVYAALAAGKRYVSYETEPAFQDGTIFETPRQVRARWYAFLAGYIRESFRCCRRHSILVSHYELLSNLVSDVFGIAPTQETELKHAEPIYLTVSEYDHSFGLTVISGQFRGREGLAIFDLNDHSIVRRI